MLQRYTTFILNVTKIVKLQAAEWKLDIYTVVVRGHSMISPLLAPTVVETA